MVVLSRPVLCCGENMRLHNMVLKSLYFTGQYFILDFLLYFFCNFHLVLIVAENGRGVLCALVIHLPVCLRRVMEREEELDQLLKTSFCVVEQNVNYFYVPCVALAHLLVRRVLVGICLWIHETNGGSENTIWKILCEILGKKLFHAPKTSSSECGEHYMLILVDHLCPFITFNIDFTAFPFFHHVLSVQLL